ncbi:hypothetical protein [Bdellovibrio sp. HCB337]|uniref:hypothetical protein n=1 Tax=Bdellovibrio sp. HCB337 TaxID=3394358 RepID=UPI0039A6E19C
MNPLPPQAYTKDTLTKAYMWLVHQNDSIKELATTPDILVSLFLKAQRNGEEALDTPSIQNFKNELKSLAGLMGELESKNVGFAVPQHQAPSAAATATQGPTSAHVYHQPAPVQQQVRVQNNQVNIQNNHVSVDLVGQLDAKSRLMVTEVREQLNLSTDLEAVRLLLSLGYHKAKTLYS